LSESKQLRRSKKARAQEEKKSEEKSKAGTRIIDDIEDEPEVLFS